MLLLSCSLECQLCISSTALLLEFEVNLETHSISCPWRAKHRVIKMLWGSQDCAVLVNVGSAPREHTPFHNQRDTIADPSCRHCKQALDVCECIRGQTEALQRTMQRTVTNTVTTAVAAKLDTKALRDISALATQTAAVVAVLVATISYTSLLSPPGGWTTLDQKVRHPTFSRKPVRVSMGGFKTLALFDYSKVSCVAAAPRWTRMCVGSGSEQEQAAGCRRHHSYKKQSSSTLHCQSRLPVPTRKLARS